VGNNTLSYFKEDKLQRDQQEAKKQLSECQQWLRCHHSLHPSHASWRPAADTETQVSRLPDKTNDVESDLFPVGAELRFVLAEMFL